MLYLPTQELYLPKGGFQGSQGSRLWVYYVPKLRLYLPKHRSHLPKRLRPPKKKEQLCASRGFMGLVHLIRGIIFTISDSSCKLKTACLALHTHTASGCIFSVEMFVFVRSCVFIIPCETSLTSFALWCYITRLCYAHRTCGEAAVLCCVL